MDAYRAKHEAKDRILDDIRKSIKSIRHVLCDSDKGTGVGNDSWLFHTLCCLLDDALTHGLWDRHRGYWPVVRDICHSDTLRIIQALNDIHCALGKGRAWLHHTLTEGSFQSYLSCIASDTRILHKHYLPHALLRDVRCFEQLIVLISGLDDIQFELDWDVAYLDMAAHQPYGDRVTPELPDLSLGPRMTSSITSSLASPVDSGVALLDSDADATSVSEATINETDNGDTSSLRDDKDDELTYSEVKDNHINQQLICLETGCKMETSQSTSPNTPVIMSPEQKVDKIRTCFVLEANCENELNDDDCVININQTSVNSALGNDMILDYSSRQKASSGDGKAVLAAAGYNKRDENHISDLTTSNLINLNTSQPVELLIKSCVGCVESRATNNEFNPLDHKKPESTIMTASVGSEEIVYRRQRRKKRNSSETKVKRVSFHDDFVWQQREPECLQADFSASFLPPNSVIKKDAIKGRYSWCGEGDAPFVARRHTGSDTKSDVYLTSCTTLSTPEEGNGDGTVANSRQLGTQSCLAQGKTPPVAERGMPEGQEDPPNMGSSLSLFSPAIKLNADPRKLSSLSSSVDWSDTESFRSSELDICHGGHILSSSVGKEHLMSSSYTQRRVPDSQFLKCKLYARRSSALIPKDVVSKNSLLNIFMKSLTERKLSRKKVKLLKPAPMLYIPGARPCPSSEEKFAVQLQLEMSCGFRSVSPTMSHWEMRFQSQVFHSPEEKLCNVFRIRGAYFSELGNRPLLAVLSDACLYLTGVTHNYSYCSHHVLPYHTLDCIIVGPNSQTLLFASTDRSTMVIVATGGHCIAQQLVSSVQFAARKAVGKLTPPAVRTLDLDDMRGLAYRLAKEVPALEMEALCHYSLVHLQDDHMSPPSTPLGPSKQGHLMFRPVAGGPLQPWEPAYFILKAGVVYMFGDKGERLPKRVIPLQGSQCHGCRRLPLAERPHTFEILLGRQRSLQFGAADEYEASDWLQAMVQSASGLAEVERVETMPCSLVLTSQHIITCTEQFPTGPIRTVSCAAIEDIISFGAVSPEQSWCVLEFGCREVHETSGDWVLYFSAAEELNNFRTTLEHLWRLATQTIFPASVPVAEALARRCMDTSRQLEEAWEVLLPRA